MGRKKLYNPPKTFRPDPKTWEEFQALAKQIGISTSDLLRFSQSLLIHNPDLYVDNTYVTATSAK